MSRSKTARRVAMLSSLTLASSFALAALPQAPVHADLPELNTVVEDFESDVSSLTTVSDGDAKLELSRSLESAVGDAAARLDFELGVGSWAGAELKFNAYTASSLSFWVRSTDVDEVTVRLVDANGQVFQHWPAVEPDGTWQQVVLDDLASAEYWGGPEDGVFAQPLNNFTIIVNNWEPDLFEPAVFIDDIEVTHSATATTGPELKMSSGNVGNIVHVDEPLTLPITAGAPYSWRVTNLYGAVLAEGSGPAGSGFLEVPTDQSGHFLLQATASDTSGTSTVRTNFGVIGDRPTGQSEVFGVATHFGQNLSVDVIDAVERGGFSFVRDEAYWHEVETVPGVYELPSKVVTYSDRLAAGNIDLRMVLSYSNDLYDDGQAPQTPEGRQAFADYAVEMIDEFGTEDVVYEVWNEWNIGLGTETPDQSAAAYVALLEVVVDAVRAAHPDAVLYGPSLAGGGIDEAWMEDFYQLGGAQLIDGISVHPYVYPDAPETLDGILSRTRAQLDSHGGQDVPIIISEHGWPTGSAQKSVDERTQAAYLLRAQAISLANGVAEYVIYDLVDDGPNDTDTEHRFGLLRHEGSELGSYTPKPAFVAQAVLMRELDDASFVSRSVAAGVHDYAFDIDGTQVRMLWAPSRAVLKLPAQGGVTVTDLTGQSYELEADSVGNITLGLSGEPLFVTGATGTAQPSTDTTLRITSAAVGTGLGLDLAVTNPDAAASYTIDVEGATASVDVAGGDSGTLSFVGPEVTIVGTRTVFGVLSQDGHAVGLLQDSARTTTALGVTARHALSDAGEQVLHITVTNSSGDDVVLDALSWRLDLQDGSAASGEVVPAGSHFTYEVPLPLALSDERYDVVATTATGASASTSGKLFIVEQWWDANQHSVVIDGDPDVPAGATALDFENESENWVDGYAGPSDLSAEGWVTWDEETLNLTVTVTDDIHHAPFGGAEMWQGDSLQLAVASGAPGEARSWSEIDLGTGPDGGAGLYRRMGEGKVPGPIQGAHVAVVRDDADRTTTYEAKIPWTELDSGIVDDGFFSFSMLVNENDAEGRRGTLEWGSGISGAKDSALFRPIRLAAAEPTTPDPDVPITPDPDSPITPDPDLPVTPIPDGSPSAKPDGSSPANTPSGALPTTGISGPVIFGAVGAGVIFLAIGSTLYLRGLRDPAK